MPNHDGKGEWSTRDIGPAVTSGLASSSNVRAILDSEMKRRRRWPWIVVFAIAIIVLVVSLVVLGLIALSYHEGQQRYGEIAETAKFDPPSAGSAGAEVDVKELTVDWNALKKANPDTVGWLYIPDTPINYPVVQGGDNEFYLYHDFDGEAGWLAEYGAIFLDHSNNPKWTDPLNFVYGHHMNDGSMFACITGFVDQSEFDAHRIVYLLTPSGNFKLRGFALLHCPADEQIVLSTFKDKSEMTAYVQDKIDRSEVDVGKIPEASQLDRVFAFATCDNTSDGRYVLYAYVLDTSVEELTGKVGIDEKEGETSGLVEDLEVD